MGGVSLQEREIINRKRNENEKKKEKETIDSIIITFFNSKKIKAFIDFLNKDTSNSNYLDDSLIHLINVFTILKSIIPSDSKRYMSFESTFDFLFLPPHHYYIYKCLLIIKFLIDRHSLNNYNVHSYIFFKEENNITKGKNEGNNEQNNEGNNEGNSEQNNERNNEENENNKENEIDENPIPKKNDYKLTFKTLKKFLKSRHYYIFPNINEHTNINGNTIRNNYKENHTKIENKNITLNKIITNEKRFNKCIKNIRKEKLNIYGGDFLNNFRMILLWLFRYLKKYLEKISIFGLIVLKNFYKKRYLLENPYTRNHLKLSNTNTNLNLTLSTYLYNTALKLEKNIDLYYYEGNRFKRMRFFYKDNFDTEIFLCLLEGTLESPAISLLKHIYSFNERVCEILKDNPNLLENNNYSFDNSFKLKILKSNTFRRN